VGNDVRKGQPIFPKGYVLKTVDAGVLATLGLCEVRVHPRPRIAVLVTGSELKPPGETLQPGEIYNANDTTLRALITAMGLPDPGAISPVPDDQRKLTALLDELRQTHDLVITSGAVSMGEFDFIPAVVENLGGKLLFHKVLVKPGKPALIADMGKSWLLGLPGNPVSVLVTFHLYGKRLIARLQGRTDDPR
jgi:molybdopterin molybdotransferase